MLFLKDIKRKYDICLGDELIAMSAGEKSLFLFVLRFKINHKTKYFFSSAF